MHTRVTVCVCIYTVYIHTHVPVCVYTLYICICVYMYTCIHTRTHLEEDGARKLNERVCCIDVHGVEGLGRHHSCPLLGLDNEMPDSVVGLAGYLDLSDLGALEKRHVDAPCVTFSTGQ